MEDQKKWEQFAERLHDEISGDLTQQTESGENIQLENSMRQIFNSRKDVQKIREFRSSELAWEGVRQKLTRISITNELLKYAAVAVIAIVSTFFGTQFFQNKLSNDEFASISSPTGQISNITLFDGTNVWLNAGSTLKYKKSFDQSDREVYLTGEALFEVTKNKKHSFIVHSGKSEIRVHGTVFDVKAYPNMNTIETVLVEGSVEFVNRGKSVFMKPGEQLVFSKSTNRFVKTIIDTAEITSWKGGKIYFNNKTLKDLTMQLERWYEVKFKFASPEFEDYRFSGVINKDKSLDYTLGIIEEINKVEFNINQDEILITNKK